MARLRWQIGFDTDIGGGRENQDDCFIWSSVKVGICVLCVLDGHGREVGKVAANIARSSLQEYFEEHYDELKTSPYNCLVRAHEVAHLAIKQGFKVELTGQGYDVYESPEGYLLKSKKGLQQWSCIHGGSTCSIFALVDGVLFTANVGDSTGLICSTLPILSKADISIKGDAAVSDSTRKQYNCCIAPDDSDKWDKAQTLVVTAEHSPESPYEFLRLRDFRPRVDCPEQPSLNIVYDTPAHEKAKCPPVFSLADNNTPIVNDKGSYYKNVRKEWASLVSTPSSARFQDALAFTRSLGDLHLHTYGCPSETDSDPSYSSSSGETETEGDALIIPLSPLTTPSTPPVLCLVLATDGVWDNWSYNDLTNFVLDPSCLHAVAGGSDGAHRVALSLMQRNCMHSKKNFGCQADNATCIVMYISQADSFPSDFKDI